MRRDARSWLQHIKLTQGPLLLDLAIRHPCTTPALASPPGFLVTPLYLGPLHSSPCTSKNLYAGPKQCWSGFPFLGFEGDLGPSSQGSTPWLLFEIKGTSCPCMVCFRIIHHFPLKEGTCRVSSRVSSSWVTCSCPDENHQTDSSILLVQHLNISCEPYMASYSTTSRMRPARRSTPWL